MTTQHTPGPWVWTTPHAGPTDEYGSHTPGPVNLSTLKSTGHYDNPSLVGPNEQVVITAGSGEYCPFYNPADAHLIAAAPDLLAELERLAEALGWPEYHPTRIVIAKARGQTPC